jgi:Na+/H+ antiporter NhaD/arsenite permease-like protein
MARATTLVALGALLVLAGIAAAWPSILSEQVAAGLMVAAGVIPLKDAYRAIDLDTITLLLGMMIVVANLVSNVPAVLMLQPFVAGLPDPTKTWLTVAMASTLAGNFTVLGSIANLIVIEKASRRGVAIGGWAYARVGIPLTVLTLAFGTWWLVQ